MTLPSRRDLLRASGVGLAAIAGCTGRDPDSNETTTRTTVETRRTETVAPTETTSNTTTSTPRDCVPESLLEDD
jgi:hypothetical protein